jgi:hypothetical protein
MSRQFSLHKCHRYIIHHFDAARSPATLCEQAELVLLEYPVSTIRSKSIGLRMGTTKD